MRLPIKMLGQSGCRLAFRGATVYLDPYLSNSVQVLDAADLERQIPIPVLPESVVDADWVLLTHEHIDHCDPHTIPKLAKASPRSRFIGPHTVLKRLAEWGITDDRVMLATESWFELSDGLQIHAVPAAHPAIDRDGEGRLSCVGFVIDYAGQRIYLAGDTSVEQEIVESLVALAPIHTAFLPVNEKNYFRNRRGIIGNMSVREAFQLAVEVGFNQVVAVHWDMFAVNAVDPDEIRLIHQRMRANFSLLINPEHLNLGGVKVSIVIRTLNEARHLESLLKGIAGQITDGLSHEVVLVDSGSTDGTLEIAERYGCRIQHISREEFSFGRSLNMGCEAATGEILVITSGHCVPADDRWLQHLCKPLIDGHSEYVYGRQLCGPGSHYSEGRIFAKYFPEHSQVPQDGFYCNNANAALLRTVWLKHRFNEDLTGLEDMELAKRLVLRGGSVAYVAEAAVFHYHNESWPQVRRRFEREAIALQKIMPQVHVNLFDTFRYFVTSIWRDVMSARRDSNRSIGFSEIACYRWNQYWGAYKGNHEHRKLSHAEKEKYFFPS
jgi:rhamnosyltransferase